MIQNDQENVPLTIDRQKGKATALRASIPRGVVWRNNSSGELSWARVKGTRSRVEGGGYSSDKAGAC